MPGRADAPNPPPPDGVAVVIPAYQAAVTIGGVVRGAQRAFPSATVYVVDDGSRDGTWEEGRGKGARVLVHPRNVGKGAALRTGITQALADGAGILVTLDADGQHAPDQIPRLVAPIGTGEADLVLGARARTGAMPFERRCSNWLSAALASRIGRSGVPDAQTGFRAMSRRVADTIRPREDHYDFEIAFLLEALTRGFRVRSIPIATVYEGRPSHFRHWSDTWRQARVFTRYGRHLIFRAR
jgi:glycosyltransferase involved in cell wall biosynthesis